MLVLSRKKNESIVINNDITITIVEIRGDKVRLGIVAPKDVSVHRQEVWEAIHGTRAQCRPPWSLLQPMPPRKTDQLRGWILCRASSAESSARRACPQRISIAMPIIAVIGASSDRSKFGNRCVRAYAQAGWTVYPVNPTESSIEGFTSYPSIADVPPGSIDLASVYLCGSWLESNGRNRRAQRREGSGRSPRRRRSGRRRQSSFSGSERRNRLQSRSHFATACDD